MSWRNGCFSILHYCVVQDSMLAKDQIGKKKNNLALQMKSKQAFNYTLHGMFFNLHTVVPSDHS